jgi:hypothetical protein
MKAKPNENLAADRFVLCIKRCVYAHPGGGDAIDT